MVHTRQFKNQNGSNTFEKVGFHAANEVNTFLLLAEFRTKHLTCLNVG